MSLSEIKKKGIESLHAFIEMSRLHPHTTSSRIAKRDVCCAAVSVDFIRTWDLAGLDPKNRQHAVNIICLTAAMPADFANWIATQYLDEVVAFRREQLPQMLEEAEIKPGEGRSCRAHLKSTSTLVSN